MNTQQIGNWLKFCFTFEQRVTRKAYLVAGIVLAVIKFAGDSAMVWLATGKLWLPSDYLSPVHALLSTRSAEASSALLPLLALWACSR